MGGARARQAAGRSSGKSVPDTGKKDGSGRKSNSAGNGSAGAAALKIPEQTGQCSFPESAKAVDAAASTLLEAVTEMRQGRSPRHEMPWNSGWRSPFAANNSAANSKPNRKPRRRQMTNNPVMGAIYSRSGFFQADRVFFFRRKSFSFSGRRGDGTPARCRSRQPRPNRDPR